MTRPNILLIMTDQQRADHTGFGGNTTVKTPHLDALAARGKVFDRAYVANPICMPNRASIMTGMMPSRHGTVMNGITLDPGCNTFAKVARQAGYRTALIGKAHLQVMNDVPEATQAILGNDPADDGLELGWPEGWDRYENMESWRQAAINMPEDFYGFDHVRLTVFHADLCSGHYYQWLKDKGIDPALIQGPKVAQRSDFETQQVWQTSTPAELYPSAYVAEEACDFIKKQRSTNEPFLLKVSFPDPHHPFTPPGKYWDMYDPADMELPDTFYDDHTKSPPIFRHFTENRGDGAHLMMPFSPTEAQYRQMLAAEYGMISMIDDSVGRIIAALSESGELQDTIIVFTSDHGDMFGDHGLMLKVGMHYEGCIRVPLFITGPGIEPGRTQSIVSSVDIAPTLIEAMGEKPYFGMAGIDLEPILKDSEVSVRDRVLIEEEHIFDDVMTGRPMNLRSVVTKEARLTVREGNAPFGELFDLAADPSEMQNLFDEPHAATLQSDMLGELSQAMMHAAHTARKPVAQA